MEILYLLCSGYCIVIILLSFYFVFIRRGNRWSNAFMAVLLFSFGFYLFYAVMYWSDNLRYVPFLYLTYLFAMCGIGSSFYLFSRKILNLVIKAKHILLALTPFLLTLFALKNYLLLSVSEKMSMLEQLREGTYTMTLNEYILKYVDVILVGCILVFAIISIIKIKRNTKDEPGEIRRSLEVISFAYAGLVLAFIIDYGLIYAKVWTLRADYAITFFMMMSISLIAYFSIWSPSIFKKEIKDEIISFPKYGRAGLTETHSIELKEQLLQIMEIEKPYLKSNLRLSDLARFLDISKNHTSQIINEHFGKSFFEFINQYRIKEAILLLEDARNKTSIIDVIYQSGFNNKVSFYKAFKKEKGLTPLEYKKYYSNIS